MSQVHALYMENPRCDHKAIITQIGSGEINKKLHNWVQLSETIFHPKGGGQPSDEGFIGGIKVAHVHKEVKDKNRLDQYEIYHCFEMDQPFNFQIGDEIEMAIDGSVRILHSRLHTAGHVLAEAANKCFPELQPYQGHHYPTGAYVRFKMQNRITLEKQKIESEFKSWIDRDIQVSEKLDPSGLRTVKVYEWWSPCGGTHVKSLKEIGQLAVGDISINTKEGTVTIKYTL